jgi:hypothetical protein
VREHHALGLARRPRGVDDRGQLLGTDGTRAVAVVLRNAPPVPNRLVPARRQVVESDHRPTVAVRGIQGDNRLDGGQQVPDGLHFLQLDLGRDDDDAGTGIVEDVLDLSLVEGRIDGDRHRPEREDCKVAQDPLRPALGDDRHAVAGRDTERGQSERDLADPLEHFARAHAVDRLSAAAADGDRLDEASVVVEWQVGDRPNVGGRLGHGLGRHTPRLKVPDRPPDFSTRQISPISMFLSAALSMS